jgi:hypothetical protein
MLGRDAFIATLLNSSQAKRGGTVIAASPVKAKSKTNAAK